MPEQRQTRRASSYSYGPDALNGVVPHRMLITSWVWGSTPPSGTVVKRVSEIASLWVCLPWTPSSHYMLLPMDGSLPPKEAIRGSNPCGSAGEVNGTPPQMSFVIRVGCSGPF